MLSCSIDVTIASFFVLQATIPGFLSKGLSIEEGKLLLERIVRLAVEARDKFWDITKRVPGHGYNRALVAASIGSYGAYLADGSEYRCQSSANSFLRNSWIMYRFNRY